MRYRKLRISWSAFWGVVVVLLIVLWVRSFQWIDGIQGQITTNYVLRLGSLPGSVALEVRQQAERTALPKWSLTSIDTDRWLGTLRRDNVLPTSRRWGRFLARTYIVVLPDWFAISLAVVLALLPWIRWPKRFSLRTLLIAATLVAVALGLIVWGTK